MYVVHEKENQPPSIGFRCGNLIQLYGIPSVAGGSYLLLFFNASGSHLFEKSQRLRFRIQPQFKLIRF
jgi:hypothetical protein